MHQIHLEQFEGPLDLLLQLIEKNQLQITEISLAKVTDQYLTYIENSDNLASTEVADFLLIASKLIYLKSKYLLPDFDLADEDDAGSLENQLKIYRQYYEASKGINRLFVSSRRFAYARRGGYKLPVKQGFSPPANASQDILAGIFADVLAHIARVVNLPKAMIARAISIGEKITDIQNMIKNAQTFNFKKILKKNDKTEIVVSFLALLELVKRREVTVEQKNLFADLNIFRNHKS